MVDGDTNESISYLDGLYREYEEQIGKYLGLISEDMVIQARLQISEKTLILVRDHLAMSIERTEGTVPRDWKNALAKTRFVGARLSEACVELLKEHSALTLAELLHHLNSGQYHFRTNTPLREIHAALLKQPGVTRNGDTLTWDGGDEEQLKMKLRVVGTEGRK